ncbi:MAG: hypothetical protein AW12_03100 [Candidatus Accumulibacter sp. BA-94]|nr:MAG: hypothetical protein AW12_03100 [Candidatus Accumulibacter sp. BA-94]
MNSFFSSALSSSHGFRTSLGQGVSFESPAITPSFFWFSKMRWRSFS